MQKMIDHNRYGDIEIRGSVVAVSVDRQGWDKSELQNAINETNTISHIVDAVQKVASGVKIDRAKELIKQTAPQN